MVRQRCTLLCPVIVVGVAAALAFIAAMGNSPVVDEVAHIGAGYSYVRKLDCRLNPEHPPLVKDLAGLPLLTLGLDESPFATRAWVSDVNGQWELGRQVIFKSGADPGTIMSFARL